MKLNATLALLLLSGLTGCGSADISGPKNSSGGKSADAEGETEPTAGEEEAAFDELVTPPQEYYDALFARALLLADSPAASNKGPEVLWINFDGATVAKGFGLGQSFIPCKATSVIPAPNLSPADKDQVVALVQQFYSDVGANLFVTQSKPTSGEFTTIHVGGAYSNLGCAGGSGVLGIAPLDGGNANRSDVGFAFTPSYADAQLIAETVAHEAGHSYGLDHVVTKTLLMYFSAGSDITGFGVSKISGSGRTQDEPAILKEVLGIADGSVVVAPPSSPATPASPAQPTIPGLTNLPVDLANLPGLDQISNLGQLIPGLATGNVLDITSLLPQLQALIPTATSGSLPGLDQILTIVGMASQAGANQQGTTVAGLPIDPALAAIILGAATGVPLDVTQLAALAGFTDPTQAISVLQALLGGAAGSTGGIGGIIGGIIGSTTGTTAGSTPAATIPNLATLPDLSQVLGLSGVVTDLPTLLAAFTGSTQIVNANFSGANRAALISMLKVAYAQQFKSLGGTL